MNLLTTKEQREAVETNLIREQYKGQTCAQIDIVWTLTLLADFKTLQAREALAKPSAGEVVE